MTEEGRTVVFVSHKLDELMAVSDRVTVLRGGRSIGTVVTREAAPRSWRGCARRSNLSSRSTP